jgi:hypothetical protein
MPAIYTQSDDTRAAILLANLILTRAAERGTIDDPTECAFTDIVDISILPAVRVTEQWYALERAGGEQRQLIRDTLVIIGMAIDMYTERALALLPPKVVAAAHAQIAAENKEQRI